MPPVLVDAGSVIGLASTLAIAAILLHGALAKGRATGEFRVAIADYQILPMGWEGLAAAVLLSAEGGAGVLILVPKTQLFGKGLGLLLLIGVTAAVIVNVVRGRTHIDCGCGGAGEGLHLSWALVARNAVLIVMATIALVTPWSPLPTWLDAVSAGALGFTAIGGYALANQLLANQPRLDQLT